MNLGAIMGYEFTKTQRIICIDSLVSVFERSMKPDYVFSGEMHDFWELLYVEEGSICVSADEKVYDLKANEVIFHKPMELHKFHLTENAKIFVMSFTLSGKMSDQFKNKSLKLTLKQNVLLQKAIDVLHDASQGGEDDYCSYLKTLSADPVQFQQFVGNMELFLLSLCNESTQTIDLPQNFETNIFKKTVLMMDKNVEGWITSVEISKALNVSVSYLKKVFAKYAGMGIHKYFVKTKINLATKLLKAGKSVSEVSEELSFSSHNYFCSVFKRETGRLPSELKAEAINKSII